MVDIDPDNVKTSLDQTKWSLNLVEIAQTVDMKLLRSVLYLVIDIIKDWEVLQSMSV